MTATLTLTRGADLFYSFANSAHLLTSKTAGADIRSALQSHLCQRLCIRAVQVFQERFGIFKFTARLENYDGTYTAYVEGEALPTVASFFKSLQTPAQKGATL